MLTSKEGQKPLGVSTCGLRTEQGLDFVQSEEFLSVWAVAPLPSSVCVPTSPRNGKCAVWLWPGKARGTVHAQPSCCFLSREKSVPHHQQPLSSGSSLLPVTGPDRPIQLTILKTPASVAALPGRALVSGLNPHSACLLPTLVHEDLKP